MRAGVRSPLRAGVAALVLALGVLAAWTAWEPLGATSAGNAALLAAGPDAKSYAKARALAETARSRNPLSPDPLFELAVIENVAGHKDAAQRALTDAVRLQPSNPATWEQLSRFALDQQNDPKLALRLLGPALYLDPKSPTGARDYLDALRLVSQQAEQQAQRTAAAKAKQQARRHKRHKKATR
jgi:cytochrome c-type biogenesis protein CcmH/NrfG